MSYNSHDENNNPLKFDSNFKERLNNFKSEDVWSEESIAEREEFYKKFGRGWWIFCEVSVVGKYQNQWINRYRVLDGEINE